MGLWRGAGGEASNFATELRKHYHTFAAEFENSKGLWQKRKIIKKSVVIVA